ncbi:hypothetical protein L6452_13825 [Arctium lappa]|uniref:Uncharacterized protein n=1 Tax=Arctium lappa TaxID=4217 RepID=A0ACB9CJA9_ARCLA|nr:hypothetical protein L6452_13825 [Arctium lappa]
MDSFAVLLTLSMNGDFSLELNPSLYICEGRGEGGGEGGAGDQRDVICDTIDKMAVDMVVLCSHGYGLIMSVSNYCVKKIKRPILIVKKPKNCSANSTVEVGMML